MLHSTIPRNGATRREKGNQSLPVEMQLFWKIIIATHQGWMAIISCEGEDRTPVRQLADMSKE